ncbi:hypothetical protein B0H34DRAFT_801327 [Crassisporium funariophilum]|nr:hypothetical protein B0H34DRAFT_801327 [Crassisporium funariophilum]
MPVMRVVSGILLRSVIKQLHRRYQSYMENGDESKIPADLQRVIFATARSGGVRSDGQSARQTQVTVEKDIGYVSGTEDLVPDVKLSGYSAAMGAMQNVKLMENMLES